MKLEVPVPLTPLSAVLSRFEFPDSPCVYFLSDGAEAVYVGQTIRLPQRIGDHLSVKDFKDVFYIRVDEKRLTEVESAFIRVLQPRLNGTKISKPRPSDIEIVQSFSRSPFLYSPDMSELEHVVSEDWGPVVCVDDDQMAGHVGYYDDNETECDEDCPAQKLIDGDTDGDLYEKIMDKFCKCEPMAIVYFGHITESYHELPLESLRRMPESSATMSLQRMVAKTLLGNDIFDFKGEKHDF